MVETAGILAAADLIFDGIKEGSYEQMDDGDGKWVGADLLKIKYGFSKLYSAAADSVKTFSIGLTGREDVNKNLLHPRIAVTYALGSDIFLERVFKSDGVSDAMLSEMSSGLCDKNRKGQRNTVNEKEALQSMRKSPSFLGALSGKAGSLLRGGGGSSTGPSMAKLWCKEFLKLHLRLLDGKLSCLMVDECGNRVDDVRADHDALQDRFVEFAERSNMAYQIQAVQIASLKRQLEEWRPEAIPPAHASAARVGPAASEVPQASFGTANKRQRKDANHDDVDAAATALVEAADASTAARPKVKAVRWSADTIFIDKDDEDKKKMNRQMSTTMMNQQTTTTAFLATAEAWTPERTEAWMQERAAVHEALRAIREQDEAFAKNIQNER